MVRRVISMEYISGHRLSNNVIKAIRGTYLLETRLVAIGTGCIVYNKGGKTSIGCCRRHSAQLPRAYKALSTLRGTLESKWGAAAAWSAALSNRQPTDTQIFFPSTLCSLMISISVTLSKCSTSMLIYRRHSLSQQFSYNDSTGPFGSLSR